MTSKAFGLAQLGNAYSDGALSNRNKIINGAMVIDQRNAGAVFTSTGLFYSLDRWLLQAVGATNTAQQVTGSTGNNKAVLITGNSGNTLTGFSQRIESWNILDLAGQAVTLSFTLSGSAASSVNIRRIYPTATDNYTGTTEPDSSVPVFFTTTPTKYTVTFTLDAAANKGLWLYFDFGAVGSGVTRTLESVQLEAGDNAATPFEHRSYGQELALCKRYYQEQGQLIAKFDSPGVSTTRIVDYTLSPEMRAVPTVTIINGGEFTSISTTNRIGNTNKLVCIDGTVGNIGNFGIVDRITFSAEL